MPKPGSHTFSSLAKRNPVRGASWAPGPNRQDNFCGGASGKLAAVAIAPVAIAAVAIAAVAIKAGQRIPWSLGIGAAKSRLVAFAA
jgi:hypothetical protein